MNEDEFMFLAEYKELCTKYRMIINADPPDSLYLYPVNVDRGDLNEHIGYFM
jgi:hypothetical protein